MKTYTHNGQQYTISELSALTGVPYNRLRHRLTNGWSVADAISTPRMSLAARGRKAAAKTECRVDFLSHSGNKIPTDRI